MKERYPTYKLLSLLICFSVADVAMSAINGVFANLRWLPWLEDGLTVAAIVCLFLLGRENWLYRWASILDALVFCTTTALTLTWRPLLEFWIEHEDIANILAWLVTVPQILAFVFTWLGHGKAVPQLRKHWILYLITYIVAAAGFALASSVVTNQYIAQEITKEAMEAFYTVFGLFRICCAMVYTFFLYRMVKIIKPKETEQRKFDENC